MLGTVLLNFFINDLEKGVGSVISKFTDDAKLFGVVKSQADGKVVQKNLRKQNEIGRGNKVGSELQC